MAAMSDETIFTAALAISEPAERDAYLDAACAGDAALRRRVEERLQAHEGTGGFLDRPAVDRDATTPPPQPRGAPPTTLPAAGTGVRIGRYKLLQQIGEGGMGAVWLAEQQEPVRIGVWDAATGQRLCAFAPWPEALGRRVGSHGQAIFSAEGKVILMPALLAERPGQPPEGIVGGWDAFSGKALFTIGGFRDGWPDRPVVTPDGKRFLAEAIVGEPKDPVVALKVWDTATGKETAPVKLPGARGRVTVTGFALSRDGSRLAVAYWQGEGERATNRLRITDGEGKTEIAAADLPGEIADLVFSPDGTRLAVIRKSAEESSLGLLDVATGQELTRWKGPFGNARVVFSPDGTRLGCADTGSALAVWDAATGRRRLTLKGHAGRAESVAFSRDGQRLVSVGFDRTVRTWDATASDGATRLTGHPQFVASAVLNAEATRVAACGPAQGDDEADDLRVWDLSGKQLLAAERRSPLRATFILTARPALSPDGRLVALARAAKAPGEGGQTRTEGDLGVWDVAGGEERLRFTEETEYTGVTFSPDGLQVAAAYRTKEGEVRVWDVATRRELHRFAGAPCASSALAYSADGSRLAFIGRRLLDQPVVVKVWEVATGRELLSLTEPSARPGETFMAVAFSRDGERVVWSFGGLEDGACDVKVHEVGTGRPVLTLRGHAGPVEQIAFSPDGRRVVTTGTTSRTSEVKLWDAVSGQELLTLKGEEGVRLTSAVFSRDGQRISATGVLTSGPEVRVKVWDATPRARGRTQ